MSQVSTRHSAALCTGSEQHAEATIISIILSANKIRQEISLVLLLLKRTGPESKKKKTTGFPMLLPLGDVLPTYFEQRLRKHR